MRIIQTKVWTINEHPDKEAVYEWIRNNWHDLSYHTLEDVARSLKRVAQKLFTDVDYSLSAFPDQHEYIKFGQFDPEDLNSIKRKDYWSDTLVIEALKKNDTYIILDAIHQDSEYIYSDDGLFHFCEANGYEFTLEGKCI